MTYNEAMNVIQSENLKRINWYDENNLKANQVGVIKKENQWLVYVTDERASIVESSIFECDSEDDAMEKLIKKARNSKILFG